MSVRRKVIIIKKYFANFIVNCKNLFALVAILLIIPSIIGFIATKTNYDILVYLPKDIETLKGQQVLADDFNMGAFSISIVEDLSSEELLKYEKEIRKIECVNDVMSIDDITGTAIPKEILPQEFLNKLAKNNTKLLLITFSTGTSDEQTTKAIDEITNMSNNIKVGGMSSMVKDMRTMVDSQITIFIILAVICCLIVLMITLDSYIIPFLLLLNIGIAVLYNMGTNIIFGEISYITKAIAAVLQLGVTTDFSIFLYHRYEEAKNKYKTRNEAMKNALEETMEAVIGSSLTTIAGFLALCSMKLTLGSDLGLVMAKGVLIGIITVLTLFPAILLIFDKAITKTKHKPLIPKFNFLNGFVIKHYKLIFIIFLILLLPAYLSQSHTKIYYQIDTSIPDDYSYTIAAKTLKEDYNMITQEMVLANSKMSDAKLNKMIKDIESIDGISSVLSSNLLQSYGFAKDILPDKIRNIFESKRYKLIIINSDYELASEELNKQIIELNRIVKSYDKNNIIAGEGPLMNDMVEISAADLKNVNYVSIAIIFIIMLLVLKSISLPILLVITIEFAIFINMGVPYWMGTEMPFVSSIVIGTIQLGATIDYAILLTTKYLAERKNKKTKLDSAKIALDTSTSSIFASAMCFFAATFSVFCISKVDMISSLCLLMSRGAIISMFVVILVLPSILIIFDKLILQTTWSFRKGSIKMKKMIKKGTVWLLLISFFIEATPVWAVSKEETIYAKVSSNGDLLSSIVYEYLAGSDSALINDKSSLKNITNVSGNEKYEMQDDKLVWEANGNNIYYSGTTDKDLPITLNIKYYLNEEEKAIEDIIGKKGKIKIIIEYKNNLKHQVLINNKIETLYTPFIVATTSLLPNENNKNIKVSSGKVIDNGNTSLIVGLSSPGLYESLDLKELKDLDKLEISYETDCFELSSIYAVATSKIFDKDDLNILNNVKNLYQGIDALQDNMNLLVDGSKMLADGTTEFNKAIGSLSNQYYSYRNMDKKEIISKITPLFEKMLNEISPALEEKVIAESIEVIKNHENELVKAIASSSAKNTKEVINGEIDRIVANINFEEYIKEIIGSDLTYILLNDESIKELTNSFKDALEEELNNEISSVINSALTDISNNMVTGINSSTRDNDIEYLVSNYGLTYDEASAIVDKISIDTKNDIMLNLINNKNTITTKITNDIITNLTNKDYIKNLIKNYITNVNNKVISIIANNPKLLEYQKELVGRIASFIKNELTKEAIIQKYNDASNYIQNVSDTIIEKIATDIANKYTITLTSEVISNLVTEELNSVNIDDELSNILNEYEKDINTKLNIVDQKIDLLSSSVSQLNDGANLLADGLNRYNEEGIKKINNLVNGNIKSLTSKIDALTKLSSEYKTLDDINNNTEGSSKIIFMIDSIKKQNDKVLNDKVIENETLWDKIKGLFK